MVLAELQALELAVSELEESCRDHPLAYWRAWHREHPRTSQRLALQLIPSTRTLIVLGGNRTGKTELIIAICVALVLGSDHPDARAFWTGNGVDPDLLPAGPERGWLIALRASDSIEYHRHRVVALLPRVGPAHPSSPRGEPWASWNLDSQDEARIEICVPGYDPSRRAGRAMLVFKSDKPGPEAMQGSRCRVIGHDEESVIHGAATWDEAAVRLIDLGGWHLMSNTPLQGETWVCERFERHPELGSRLVRIYAADNPYLPPEAVAELSRDPRMADARTRGMFVAVHGRVYPMFDRAVHVVPTVPLPAHWPRFRAIDFGTRHPFVCSWLALARSRLELPDGRWIPDGSIVVYREHYQAEWTLRQHVEAIRAAEGDERPELSWADPEDAQQLLSLVVDHGLDVIPADKRAQAAGIDAVATALSPQVDGLPGLYFFDCCPNTIREHEGYTLAPGHATADRDRPDRPKAKDDHTCDTVRYGVRGIRTWY